MPRVESAASARMATSPGRARSRDRDDDPPPAVRLSAVTLGIPFFTHLLGLAATWAALKQLQILWICDEVLGPEVPEPGLPVNVTGAPIRLLDRCDAPEVQATASAWFTALSLCYNVPSLVLVPIFGYFLDRWSRKRIILVAMSFSSWYLGFYTSCQAASPGDPPSPGLL